MSKWEQLRDVCEKGWNGGGKETRCGGGSLRSYSQNVIQSLPGLFARYDINTVADCGCGDWNWMSEVDLSGIDRYTGYDWVIRERALDFKSDKVEFRELNIGTEIIDRADMIICRDVLIHMTNEMVLQTIENFRKSGSKYLLATTDSTVSNAHRHNIIRAPSFSPINLQIEPFGLGDYKDMIEDVTKTRFMGLWEL